MNRTINPKEIIGGYAIAAATLCLGYYLSVKIAQEAVATLLFRGLGVLAVALILKYTFAWGRLRGFAVKRKDGGIDGLNLCRTLVAAAIVLVCVVLLSGPVILALVKSAR